jgi:hypothetical protein
MKKKGMMIGVGLVAAAAAATAGALYWRRRSKHSR